MTIEEKIKAYLEEKGMQQEQAEAVLSQMKKDDEEGLISPMKGRWEDEAKKYSNAVLAALLVAADKTALAWIDENKPKAWFRPMFAGFPDET